MDGRRCDLCELEENREQQDDEQDEQHERERRTAETEAPPFDHPLLDYATTRFHAAVVPDASPAETSIFREI